jgi:hypothetical protein
MKSTTIATSKKHGCQHRRPDGHHCKARPLKGGRYCFWHDPNRAVARKEAGRTGGQRRRARTLPSETADFRVSDASSIVDLLSRTVNQTLRGEVDPKVANAIGYLSGVILRAREQGEIEERAAKIEEILKVRGS